VVAPKPPRAVVAPKPPRAVVAPKPPRAVVARKSPRAVVAPKPPFRAAGGVGTGALPLQPYHPTKGQNPKFPPIQPNLQSP